MAQNFSLKTTTFGGEINFLDSQQTRSVRGGVTLDAAAVTADAETGLKKLLAGTFIGKDSATDKYKKYVPGVKASKTTGVVGSNNAILWTAVTGGVAGNGINVALLNPGGNNKPLEVTVVNNEIRVSLATGAAGAISSTAADVIDAVNASLLAKDLVVAANSGASDGTGVVAAVAAAALANGADANVVPTLLLAEDVIFTTYTQSGGVAHLDQVATAYDQARVIVARLPEAPNDAVKAGMPGISFV
jgi:hypothetical protein